MQVLNYDFLALLQHCMSFKSCTTSVFHLLHYYFLGTVPSILDKKAMGAKYCVGIGDKKNEELFRQMIGDVNVFCVSSVL